MRVVLSTTGTGWLIDVSDATGCGRRARGYDRTQLFIGAQLGHRDDLKRSGRAGRRGEADRVDGPPGVAFRFYHLWSKAYPR